jgi:hypothetical protein
MFNLKIVKILSDGSELHNLEETLESFEVTGIKFKFTARTKSSVKSCDIVSPNTTYNVTGTYMYGSNGSKEDTSLYFKCLEDDDSFNLFNWDLEYVEIPFNYIEDCNAYKGLSFIYRTLKLFNLNEEEKTELYYAIDAFINSATLTGVWAYCRETLKTC